MVRNGFRAAFVLVCLSGIINPAEAQVYPQTFYGPGRTPAPRNYYRAPAAGFARRAYPTAYVQSRQPGNARASARPTRQSINPAQTQAGYPYLNAPLYPSPNPNVPHQIGGTAITNQAFAPHEMLYAHEYNAMYGPFYYKSSGHWFTTPGGVWSADEWELVGTRVKVKYKPRISIFTFFTPPYNP